MNRGTKSLLFGAHQFFIHPFTVWLAWIKLHHKAPTWKELVCILIHDWGYWGCKEMDGEDGANHPIWAATQAMLWFDHSSTKYEYYCLCMYHSRHMAKKRGSGVSPMFYADKLSFAYVPWWLYIFMARLSGELQEYKALTLKAGWHGPDCSDRDWHRIVRHVMVELSKTPDAAAYLHGENPCEDEAVNIISQSVSDDIDSQVLDDIRRGGNAG